LRNSFLEQTMDNLQEILAKSSARHRHLCPRQVLGVRVGLAGAQALGLDLPRRDKRLLIFVETDGCFADGVDVATGCTMGHRTLRLEDYGKIAATFVDVKTETAVRVSPQPDIRDKARSYAPEEKKRYYAQLTGYQRMPRRRTAHHPAGTSDHAGQTNRQPQRRARRLCRLWRRDHQRAGNHTRWAAILYRLRRLRLLHTR
jgi:formylmethanofuran dehydrogenase subunit E